MSELKITANQRRLSDELEQLAAFSDTELPEVTRVLYTDVDLKARVFLKKLCVDAGLIVREDAIGNMFARWVGIEATLPAVGTGSHIDAIPHSGKYDGTVGVLGGLEAIRTLQAAGFRPKRSLELLMFTSEEPTRFGLGCIGSRTLSGNWSAEKVAELKDENDQRFDDVRRAAGFHGDIKSVKLPPDYYSAFVELHIEQAPLLEKAKLPIGVVTAIAAPAALRVQLEGQGGHAGGVLMADRHDALCAAAEIVLAVERGAKSSGSPDTVGTVGICRVHPGVVNGIPSRVQLEIDIRDIDFDRRNRVVDSVRAAIGEISEKRDVASKSELMNSDGPATTAKTVIDATEAACSQLGLKWQRMVSRAYHDSLFMAQVFPTGMIFIPCRGGVSHRPDEYASPDAIKNGVEVLALTMAKLSA